jgi:hypothetical protein
LISTASAVIGSVRDRQLEWLCGASLALALATGGYAAHMAMTSPAFRPQLELPAAPAAEAAPATPPKPEPLLTMVEPVAGGAINSPFGLRRLPWENHGRLHEGVDISGDVGDPVLAAADGVVVRAGNSASYGRFVEIHHKSGLNTLYAHMGRLAPIARPGAKVEGGQAIGKVGSSGTSTGPHVHFEVRRKDRPLDPTAFIGQSFATFADLPLTEAARYSRKVRVAQVSFIPETKRALMAERQGEVIAKKGKDGRPRASLTIAKPSQKLAVVEEAPSAEIHGADASAHLPAAPVIPTAPLEIDTAD